MRTTIDPQGTDVHRAAVAEAVASLGRAVGSLRCAGSQRLVRLGISMTHFHVLTLLRHHDAMPMSRIADILGASLPGVTGIVGRMEERGLVERVRVAEDRRIVLVRPTQAGIDLVDEAELIKSDLMTAAISRLSEPDLADLARAVDMLRTAIDAEMSVHAELAALAGTCGHPDHRAALAHHRVPTPAGQAGA
jgi:DNA-binding MarR family transcriptional regulator